MDNKYILQYQNSVTKVWYNTCYGTFDGVEQKYNEKISTPECKQFNQKWRMIEFSVIHAN